jgi:RNA recognition motif-containing protein
LNTAIAGKQSEHTTILVEKLAENTNEDDIRALFDQYGSVCSVDLIPSTANRRGDGCCYLKMRDHPAKAAISALDGKVFRGSILRVSEALVKPSRSSKPHRAADDVVERNAPQLRYQVVSVEKAEMPSGTEGDDWYRYVLSSGSSRITGFRRGSWAEVREYATQCADEFNLRSVRAKSTRPIAPAKKK